jgi:hypothetical protein
MRKVPFNVKYRYDNTQSTRIIHLYEGAGESSAISYLKSSGGVGSDKEIVILSMEKQ